MKILKLITTGFALAAATAVSAHSVNLELEHFRQLNDAVAKNDTLVINIKKPAADTVYRCTLHGIDGDLTVLQAGQAIVAHRAKIKVSREDNTVIIDTRSKGAPANILNSANIHIKTKKNTSGDAIRFSLRCEITEGPGAGDAIDDAEMDTTSRFEDATPEDPAITHAKGWQQRVTAALGQIPDAAADVAGARAKSDELIELHDEAGLDQFDNLDDEFADKVAVIDLRQELADQIRNLNVEIQDAQRAEVDAFTNGDLQDLRDQIGALDQAINDNAADSQAFKDALATITQLNEHDLAIEGQAQRLGLDLNAEEAEIERIYNVAIAKRNTYYQDQIDAVEGQVHGFVDVAFGGHDDADITADNIKEQIRVGHFALDATQLARVNTSNQPGPKVADIITHGLHHELGVQAAALGALKVETEAAGLNTDAIDALLADITTYQAFCNEVITNHLPNGPNETYVNNL